MTNNILILTGGSKGIGLALANYYCDNNFKVFSLARTINTNLPFTQLKVDLINNDITSTFNSILNEIHLDKIKKITLINNAGRLGQIGNLETIKNNDIDDTIHLNLILPLQLTSLFIKHTKVLKCNKTIINISSGAAIKAYSGWSVYCASKAALDIMTKVIALENPNYKSIGIRPGIVDTQMQEQIRNTNAKNFKLINKFINLYKNNQLLKPKNIAKKIYEIDIENRYKSGEILRI